MRLELEPALGATAAGIISVSLAQAAVIQPNESNEKLAENNTTPQETSCGIGATVVPCEVEKTDAVVNESVADDEVVVADKKAVEKKAAAGVGGGTNKAAKGENAKGEALKAPFSEFTNPVKSAAGTTLKSFAGNWTEDCSARSGVDDLMKALGVGMIKRTVANAHTFTYEVTLDKKGPKFSCHYPTETRVFDSNTNGKEYDQNDATMGAMKCQSTFNKGTLYTRRVCADSRVVEDSRAIVGDHFVVKMVLKDGNNKPIECVRKFKKKK